MEKVARIKTTSISHKGGKYGGAGGKTLALLSLKSESAAPEPLYPHTNTSRITGSLLRPLPPPRTASHLKNVWHRDPRGNVVVFDFVARHCALEQMVT